MKILILGDYSSFGLNLKKGFEKEGIKTILLSTGDSWKKIDGSDIKLSTSKFLLIKILKKIYNRHILNSFYKKNLKSFDYILIMNQEFIKNKFSDYFRLTFGLKELQNLKLEKGKIFLLACGTDFYELKNKFKLRYSPYDDITSENKKYFLTFKEEEKLLKNITAVIPTMYEYSLGYRESIWKNKTLPTIPLCIDVSEIPYKDNKIIDKIIIFHGINREGFKGSEIIKRAMENIKIKYPEKVEIIINGKMPLKKYKEVLEKANIIIDQCRSYSYGMNALYSMALGKVVLSGNEKECQEEFKRSDIPILNIPPVEKEIEEKLEYLIKNPHLIEEIGKTSRKFVEEFHDCKVVIKKYIEIFNKEKNEK